MAEGTKMGADNSPLAHRIKDLLKKSDDRTKELKKIEEMIQKENEEIRQQLEETVREIRESEEEKFRQTSKVEEAPPSLETTVEEEHPEPAPQTSQFGYSNIDSSMLQEGNVGVYDIARQDVYEKVKNIMDTPTQFRTNEERNFLKGVTYQIDRIQREEMYISKKDPDEFMKRTQNVISSFYK